MSVARNPTNASDGTCLSTSPLNIMPPTNVVAACEYGSKAKPIDLCSDTEDERMSAYDKGEDVKRMRMRKKAARTTYRVEHAISEDESESENPDNLPVYYESDGYVSEDLSTGQFVYDNL